MKNNTTIVWSKDNIPAHVIMSGGNMVITEQAMNTKVDKENPGGEVVPSFQEEIGKLLWVNWGSGNDLPRELITEVRKNGVASQAIRLKTQVLYGQKVIPCRVVDLDPNTGKETVEYVQDKEINAFLKRSNINQLRAKSALDYIQLGNIFPMPCLNEDRSEIVMMSYDKAAKFRYAPFNVDLGRIDQVYRSANWPNPNQSQYEVIKVIDSSNWYYEIDRIKLDDQVKYAYPINCLDVLNDYYAITHWMGIYFNNVLQNSNTIPQIEKSVLKNIWSLKYHIEISKTYWEQMYPGFERLPVAERTNIVNALYKTMNDFLSGKDNQMKTFISTFGTDQNGKPIPGIIINVIEDKDRTEKWLPNSTAYDSQILFGIGINPAIFGLASSGGAPSGGANNGGSNIRESWLTMIAAAQLDRDLLYGWWDFVKGYNGYDDDIELRTIDKVLTTLDTGSGTSKTLS